MSSPTTPGSPTPNPAEGQDPSMEDILASIRRILSEEEPAPEATSSAPPLAASPALPAEPPEEDVLDLDASMMVPDPVPPRPEVPEAPAIRSAPTAPVVAAPVPAAASPLAPAVAPAAPPMPEDGLMEQATTEVAASSIVNLVRTIASERATQVHRGGPTIEDLVREEIRPVLKLWLDTNLPPLVERLVQAEIQRVVGRALS